MCSERLAAATCLTDCVCWYRCSMSPRSSQPRWRRPYNTNIKSLHPPALTFVLAEPKQAAALHSATSRLPSVLRSASPQSETSSMTSKAHEDSLCEPASHPTDKLLRSEVVACPQEPTNQDPSPGRVLAFACLHAANSSLLIHTTHVAGKAETTTTTMTGDTQDSSEVASAVGSDPNPATTADPPQLAPKTTEQILANKRSWLTAFAWRKEPEANPPVPEPISTRSDSPEGQSKQDPPVHPSPQPIDAVVAVTQTKEALRPQDSTSQLQDVTKSQPRPETAKDNVSTSPKPQPGPLDTLHPADKSGSTASLGATPTKFTLGMPLLGRPKVPLEKAMADARKEDSGSAQKAQSESRPKENREQGAPSP